MTPVILGIALFVLGCICYDINTRQPPLIAVDIQRVIRQTAEGFAKANLSEDQLQQKIMVFKRDLDASLKEFAALQKSLVIPSHIIHGDVNDMTDAFITYHNNVEPSTSDSRKATRS